METYKRLHGRHKEKISTEMYLKAIFLLKDKNKTDPRAVDIVKELELSKGSVSEMLNKICEEGLIHYQPHGRISLSDKGVEQAKNVIRKFEVIKKFLSEILKIDPGNVDEEACNLEHGFSDEAIAKLNILIKLMERNPEGKATPR